MFIPLIAITPPTNNIASDQLWSYFWYILIVIIGAIFATEYAAWRITRKVKDWETNLVKKAKEYEKKVSPLLDMIAKIDPEQIDAVLKAVADVAGTVKSAIDKPKAVPKPPDDLEN